MLQVSEALARSTMLREMCTVLDFGDLWFAQVDPSIFLGHTMLSLMMRRLTA